MSYQNCAELIEFAITGETTEPNLIIDRLESGDIEVYLLDYNGIELGLTEYCCSLLNSVNYPSVTGFTYTWDSNYGKCKWLQSVDCDNLPTFNVTLNPQIYNGDGAGAKFTVDSGENCVLEVKFDYMFHFNCADILAVSATTVNTKLDSLYEQLEYQTNQLNSTQAELSDLDFEFNYVIPYTNEDGFTIYLCLTEAGIPLLRQLIEDAYEGDPNAWEDYLNNDITAEDLDGELNISGDFFDFSNQPEPQDLYYNICNDGNELIQANEDYLSALQGFNDSISSIQNQINVIQAQIDFILANNPDACLTETDVFERLNIGMSIDIQNPQSESLVDTIFSQQIFNVGRGNLLQHFINNTGSTGFYIGDYNGVDCTSTDCDALAKVMVDQLIAQGDALNLFTGETIGQKFKELTNLIGENYFDSNWLRFETIINDPVVISGITNQLVNLSIQVIDHCANFSILVDRIEINKICERKVNDDIIVSTNPRFNLTKVIDNKKSWVAKTSPENRLYELPLRETDYDTNHHRLVINTKETDLNISIANGIETDIWCYVNENQCILNSCETTSYSGLTGVTCCCGDFTVTATTITGGTVTLPPEDVFSCGVSIGDSLSGGTVFWINPNNSCDMLIVSGTDVNIKPTEGPPYPNMPWININCTNQFIDATNPTLGGGEQNTQDIVDFCPNGMNFAAYAASTFSSGSVTDWYLPNVLEFQLILNSGVGSLTPNVGYWTSTEYSNSNAIAYDPQNGFIPQRKIATSLNTNDYSIHVRAIKRINTSPCLNVYNIMIGVTGDTSLFEIENTECTWIYKFDSNTSPITFNGFWLAGMPDGTVGVFQHTTISGVTATTVDYTPIITKECCEAYDDALRDIEVYHNLGRHLERFRWDEGCQACLYKKCTEELCLDFNDLFTSEYTGLTTVNQFNDVLTSELINVRCRKISSSYPTLQALYRRYLKSRVYCEQESSEFTYDDMIDFAGLIGNYWIELFEQVIPSTTIWTANYIYGNTLYDQQKFKYRSGSVFPCSVSTVYEGIIPFNPTSQNDVPVHSDVYVLSDEGLCKSFITCDDIYYYNGDCGSEFIGTVTITNTNNQNNTSSVVSSD